MKASIYGIALDCPDADGLADFYASMLGLEKTISEGEWAGIQTPQGVILAFQTVPGYVPPVWPWAEGEQQQMAHVDFLVEDLDAAVAQAIECGTRLAPKQYYKTSTVLIDPAGHPFCLAADVAEEEM